jgi:hypothetical protein
MTEPARPVWIRKRAGSIVPFEPDKISRALFHAGEELGKPDAFLARELTDGVLHFLGAELNETTPTTAQLAELVVKVVRELGQPDLAQAFTDGARVRSRGAKAAMQSDRQADLPELRLPCPLDVSAEALVASCMRGYSLAAVFARDLVAAQCDGLLELGGLEGPFEMAACVLGRYTADRGVFDSVEAARRLTGHVLSIDSPEHELMQKPEEVPAYARELGMGLRSARLQGIVNLNCATPPSWAGNLGAGPLFAAQQPSVAQNRMVAISDDLLEYLLPIARVDWHLAEQDFRPEAESRLTDLARRAIEGAALAFVFDRPRSPVALAEGIDRQHPAALLTVGLPLPRLATQVAGNTDAPTRFLQKLGSLVRLGLSAGIQKRDFLRRRGEARLGLTRGFLLDRARLIVAPIGLGPVVAGLVGETRGEGSPGLEFARRIVERLSEVVREDGQSRHLAVVLDGSRIDETEPSRASTSLHGKNQLRIAGTLHRRAELGTLALHVLDDPLPQPEEVIEWLKWAWKRTDVTRLRLVRVPRSHQQLTFDGT